MGRILANTEFPFVVPVGAIWDGSTFVTNGSATFSGSDEAIYTPDWVKTGAGTIYPLPGMTLDTAVRMFKRVRAWDYHENIDGDELDFVLRAGATAQDEDDGAQQESDLSHRFGLTKNEELSEGFYSGIVFRLFVGGYDRFPILVKKYEYDGIDEFPSGFTIGFQNGGPMVRHLVSSTMKYFPLCVHGMSEDAATTSTKVRSGDLPSEVGGTAVLTLDESTLTFSGSGTGYSFTVQPKATGGWWEYGGLYDPNTGLPV